MFVISTLIRAHRKRRLTKHLSSSILRRIAKLLGFLLLLVAINSVAMVVFESMSVSDAVWLSFTTVTTVGYGDFSPSTVIGRIVTIVSMYGFAITMLSLLAAEVIEWRLDKSERKRKGLWEFKDMADHIQIINTPNVDTERYLLRLVQEIHLTPALQDMPIQLLTRKYAEGLPDSLSGLKVLHRHGAAEEGAVLHELNLHDANHIVILARDAGDSISDSLTFDILSRVVKINPNANIVVEAVLDENRERFLELGAHAVMRPIRAYPEVIVRALTHPGTERVLEDMFDAYGDSIHRVSCSFKEKTWAQIVEACIEKRIGTPLAYFSGNDVAVQPEFDKACSGDALAILAKEENLHRLDELKAALA